MASETTLFEDANKDFLTCSICKAIYKHPKQLKCMHSFCQDCLQPLVTEGTLCKIRCTLCREEVELGVDSVDDLEDNIFLSNLCELFLTSHLNTTNILCSFCSEVLDKGTASRCIDCSDNLCDKCAKIHIKTRVTRKHQVILMSELETENLVKKVREGNDKTACQYHPSNPLKFFCQTCQVPVCFECTVVDHVRQNGHDLKNLHDDPIKETFKEQITNQVHQLEQMIPYFEEQITMTNAAEKCLNESLEKTKKDIRTTAMILIVEIESHTQELIEKVDERAKAIRITIENHKEAAEIRVKSSTGVNQFAKNLCKHGLAAEIMSSAKTLLRRMNELQEDLNDIGTGELMFIEQKEFKLGKVVECKERSEYTLLEYYTKKEMAVGDSVKRGPNWPACDPRDDSKRPRYSHSTIQKIQRNGPNKTVSTSFQKGQTIDCKMNRREYWLQPTNPSQSYLSRLAFYAEKEMKVSDIVHWGVHWPKSHTGKDEYGSNGKIIRIDRNPGKTMVSVDFGQHGIICCRMDTHNYWLLPLEPITWVEWAEI